MPEDEKGMKLKKSAKYEKVCLVTTRNRGSTDQTRFLKLDQIHLRAIWTNWSPHLTDRGSLLRNWIFTDRFILDKERRERKERENRDSGSAKNRDSRGPKENREKDRDRDKSRKHEKSRRDETSEERRIRKEKKRKDEKKSRSEGYLGKLSGLGVGVKIKIL